MDPALIIDAAVFVGVLAVVGGLALVFLGGRVRAGLRAERRLATLGRAPKAEAADPLRREEDAGSGPAAPWLERRLRRAGLAVSPGRVMAAAAGLSLVALALLLALSEAGPAFAAAVALPAGPAAAHVWLSGRTRRRLSQIEEMLPDAIELMVRSLRVGHPFSAAVQIVARETRGPLAAEMALIADETAYGRDVGEALTEMADRVGLQDLRFLAVAVTIQSQSGGNLAEVLDGLAKVIRARFKLFRKVRAITAEAKWSGTFLSGFPLVALLAIQLTEPDYFDPLRGTGYLMPGALAVGVFLLANVIVMRRLVDIKV